MDTSNLDIVKSSGLKDKFSLHKLENSLIKSGADPTTIKQIVQTVLEELYPGISTKEIYNRAFSMLKKKKGIYASKYKLKKAIYELGPSGFPFENFVGTLLHYSGYKIKLRKILEGACVKHEVDIIARKNERNILVECKFHNEVGKTCNVKVPLYIHSRYQDILEYSKSKNTSSEYPTEAWLVTNTRFTLDAITFGNCVNLYLLSWDYPKGNSLKERIDRLALYPITASTLLSEREKQFLLSRDIVLMRQLIKDVFYLDHLGVSEIRKTKIKKEIQSLCNP